MSQETSNAQDQASVVESKKRAFFSEANKSVLFEEFKKNPYPNEGELGDLASALQFEFSIEKIRKWFKNERDRQGLSGKVKKLGNYDLKLIN